MADDTLKKLGSVRAKDEGRDAVHIAVLTLQAKENFTVPPIGNLWVNAEGDLSYSSLMAVGIIDPFLQRGLLVEKGDWYYVYLKPGSITGLRHVWDHAAFPETTPVVLTPHGEMIEAAKDRVRGFCEHADMSLDYFGFIELFQTGESGHFSWDGEGSIYAGDEEISADVPLSIVRDVELIIGRELGVQGDLYFRCAC